MCHMNATTQEERKRGITSFPLKNNLDNSHTGLYEKIRWYLDNQKIYLDRELSLVKFSSIVGTAIELNKLPRKA